jgi:hypothetical protein
MPFMNDMGDDEEVVLQFLDRLLAREPVRAYLDGVVKRTEQRLQNNPGAVMAWEPVALDLYGTALPGSIHSSWVFILKANAATGAERHPNSRQRIMSYRGSGDLQTRTNELWYSNLLLGDPKAPLGKRWLSIPEKVWHQAVTPEANWVVVSFHTVPAEELIEERPTAADGSRTQQRKYIVPINSANEILHRQ